jgi:hypothetical protein
VTANTNIKPAGRARIPELATIDVNSTSAFAEYTRASRKLCRDLAAEFDFAAAEIQTALIRSSKQPLLHGIAVRYRARKVSRRLRRARDCAIGAGIECVAAWHTFQREFEMVVAPPKQKARAGFDFRN